MVNVKELVKGHTPPWMPMKKEFIPGKTPVYYAGPYFDETELTYAIEAFLNGKWLTAGENVHKFEIAFSKKFNVGYSLMVNSGSSANLAMIAALKKRYGWKDGDEIIVSPVGFPTTIAPIVQNGLVPVFADIEMETLNFDLREVQVGITRRTKAIFVSPVLGNPPDIENLLEMAEVFNLKLIGDNCDSLGSRWGWRYITDFYDAWTSSFYPAHHITTGEGGMVSSNDEELIKISRSIAWWGRDCYCVGSSNLLPCGTCGKRFDKWLDDYDGIVDHKYVFSNMGYNLKPLDLQGAIGLAQLEKFDVMDRARKSNFKFLEELLFKKIWPDARTVVEIAGAYPSWFGFPIMAKDKETKERLQKHFEDNKIQTRNYFAGNILLHPAYSYLDNWKYYPNANKAMDTVFFLGCSPHYTPEILKYIEEVFSMWRSK